MGGQEQAFVDRAFESNWVAPLGPNVDAFEEELCQALELENGRVVALSSGTAAIHLALICLGVGPGDEVICSSFTFSATANPVMYLGAIPVFVDSEPHTWNMDPQRLRDTIAARRALGKKVAAVVVVDLYGMPAQWNEIREVCTSEGVPIVEDSAEALGATYREYRCGGLAPFAILSFNGNKIITTSGGGALVCPDPSTAQHVRFLSTQARDPAPHYEHSQVGYNYRMSNILAGVGRGQLLVLSERVRKKREVHDFYAQLVQPFPGLSLAPSEPTDVYSNRWLTTALVDPKLTGGVTREDVRLRLEADGIETRPLWKPLHLQPVFADCPYSGGTVAERLFDIGLCLPSSTNMSDLELERIQDSLSKIFRR